MKDLGKIFCFISLKITNVRAIPLSFLNQVERKGFFFDATQIDLDSLSPAHEIPSIPQYVEMCNPTIFEKRLSFVKAVW